MGKNFIMAYIQPFILKQKVSVYKDGKCIETIKCRFDELEDTIMGFVKGYGLKKINLAGQNPAYSIKIKDRLISKYTDKELDIDIY